jgi:hypothetical protein
MNHLGNRDSLTRHFLPPKQQSNGNSCPTRQELPVPDVNILAWLTAGARISAISGQPGNFCLLAGKLLPSHACRAFVVGAPDKVGAETQPPKGALLNG